MKTDYDFTVDGADPMVAHWRLNEQLDDWGEVPPLADATGNGHTATMLAGGTVGADGRVPGATAALFDGVDDQATTTGPVLADTTRSFSVSAWVRLDSKKDGSHTIVGQYGNNNGAFLLQYVKSSTVDVWKITAPTSDDSVPAGYPSAQSANGAPKTGLWTHLAGVYDEAAKTLKLYVNGKLVQTASGVTTWDANGSLRIGSNGWHGAVSDVRVWQRVLFDGEIKDLVESMDETKVGEYHFGEVDNRFALDSSNYGHTLNLSGGATIPASGAGYDRTGLLLMDGTGEAVGASPSIFTSQSYTVSAWVRMDGAGLPTRTYTAVGHAGWNVSALYLGYRPDGGTPTWAFYVPGEDKEAGGTGGVTVRSAAITTAVLGTWVHLQGTVDAETGAVRLYVNGALAASGTRSAPLWDASGALTVGSALWSPTGGAAEDGRPLGWCD